MKKINLFCLGLAAFLALVLVSCSSSKSDAEKTLDTYFNLLKSKNFARA